MLKLYIQFGHHDQGTDVFEEEKAILYVLIVLKEGKLR